LETSGRRNPRRKPSIWVVLGGRIERGRESSRHLAQGKGGSEEESEEGGQLGPRPVTLILKCGATQNGVVKAIAAPLSMAPH
jgi:hypothetical protein